MYNTKAIAKHEKNGKFELVEIGRGWTSEDDIDIDVEYCGFCHTDCHLVDNDFGSTSYPAVAGHEIAGIVTKIGSNVKDVKIGDHVGVGYYMDSCLECDFCKKGEEINCDKT